MSNTKTITKKLHLTAPPQEVYRAFLSSDKHSEFTGAPAKFDPQEGGSFATFNKMITGEILQLKENQKIELKWRAGGFPDNYYTKVIIELHEKDTGTELDFTHEGVPADAEQMITEGWEKNYWQKLPDFFTD